jgi:hypothetical protein
MFLTITREYVQQKKIEKSKIKEKIPEITAKNS